MIPIPLPTSCRTFPGCRHRPTLDQVLRDPSASRRAGAVLGAAIGDAIGHPTEFMSMSAIRSRYGPDGVTGFELYWDRGGRRFAPYTDDTRMAEVVLRALLWSEKNAADLDAAMKAMANGFVAWADRPQGGHRAPGNACMAGCRALANGAPWSEAGGASAGGCGSVMRAYPFGLVFADDLERAERWAVAHSRLTHRDPIAAAVYIAARHPDDARAAILEGANTPGDSDSLATLAGALVGARTGLGGLPVDWVAEVERSDVLLQLACAIHAG